MKGVFGFFSVIILLVFFSSCQKEINWGFSNIPQSDSIFLKSYIELDTSFSSGIDTSEKAIFTYDSQKRITRIDGYVYTAGVSGITDLAWDQRFYNGNDTLPYKIIWKESGSLDVDTAFIWYSNGSVSRDSTILQQSGSTTRKIQNFTRLSSTRIFERRTIVDALNTVLLDDSLYFIRNFLSLPAVLASDSDYNVFPLGALYFVQTFDIQVDNNPNPFNRLNFNYPPDFGEYVGQPGIFWGGDLSLLKNNFKSFIHSYSSPPGPVTTITTNYTYEYRNDGYPVVSRFNNGVPTKAIYLYTKL